MSLILNHCIPSDAPACAEACIATYERMPRHIATMGSVSRERQVEIYTATFRTSIESQDEPTANRENHVLKVIDQATNEIVAFAIWTYLPNGYKVEEDSFANVEEVPEGVNERLMRHFGSLTGVLRGEHEGRRGPHWLLSLLGTHPKHERRGAGAMLIRWGCDQADKGQKKCYVDASSVGYRLYKRCGFEQDVGEVIVDFDEYGAEGVGVHKWVAMLREPQPQPTS